MCIVLLVEDEVLLATAMQDELQRAGHQVIGPAARREDALQLVRQNHVDVALVDYNLVDGTAEPLLQALERQGIPFACLTARPRDDISSEWQDRPYFRKPVVVRDILELLMDISD
jgi:DNA-binding response OmpR family regulator